MHSFKDSKGREWRLRITFASAQELLDECGVDIGDDVSLQKLNHWRTRGEAIVVLIREQLAEANVSPAEAHADFDAETWERATKALELEIAFFTRGQNGRKAMTSLQARRATMIDVLAKRIENGKADGAIQSHLPNTDTDSPESSA